ncbi:hypothetical protein [Mycobacterium marinum]|uniref:hypothetical protein n=1 Tax=Mycobacterium marinum TaxID=1781 RepID=UPI000B9642BA|nr:hypothetical protein [Mycobacterium marinum]
MTTIAHHIPFALGAAGAFAFGSALAHVCVGQWLHTIILAMDAFVLWWAAYQVDAHLARTERRPAHENIAAAVIREHGWARNRHCECEVQR